MGYNFTPNEKHTIALNKKVDEFEDLLEEFIKKIKGYNGVQLIVKRPGDVLTKKHSYHNPIEPYWYDSYPEFVKDCELRLLITIKGRLLSSDKTDTYAKVRLTRLPACCGVCVMNGMELHNDIREKGAGKAFTGIVEAFAKVLNYSYVMCTTHKVNGPAIGVLESLGYTELDDGFVNMRTKNSIRMFGKNVNTEGKSLTDGYLDLKEN